jgi:hypothetical protein
VRAEPRLAFVVTLGSSLAALAVTPFVWTLFLARGTAIVPGSAMFFVLPQIVSLTVGYQLLKRLAPARTRSAPRRLGADLAEGRAEHYVAPRH